MKKIIIIAHLSLIALLTPSLSNANGYTQDKTYQQCINGIHDAIKTFNSDLKKAFRNPNLNQEQLETVWAKYTELHGLEEVLLKGQVTPEKGDCEILKMQAKEIKSRIHKLANNGYYEEARIASPDNGWGIVYNISDCGQYAVRMYQFGGAGPGSSCGYWLSPPQLQTIWYRSTHGDDQNFYLSDVDYPFQVFCKVITQAGVDIGLAALGPEAETLGAGYGDFLSQTFCE